MENKVISKMISVLHTKNSKAYFSNDEVKQFLEAWRTDMDQEVKWAYNQAIQNSADLAGENGVTDKQSILNLLIP